MQSRTHSAVESATNQAIGFAVALASQRLIFPLFDIHLGPGQHVNIALWFTAVSVVRGYVVRRVFNRLKS